jgi:hypothetical protein
MSHSADVRNWQDIQAGMKFTAALDQPEPAPIAAASGEPDTAETQDDEAGMPLNMALSLLRLRQISVLQDMLANAESQAELLDCKAKSLSTPAGNAQRYADRAEGSRNVLTIFSSNFSEAVERVKTASESERLSLNAEDARLFASVSGKAATVQIASPMFPVRYDAASAETILANTRKQIEQMGKKS